jgi:hypothetical protein
MTMQKPVRLEINNSGAWKVIGRFDAADDVRADDILNCAHELAAALCDAGSRLTLRVSMADLPNDVLMRWESIESGWRDPQGEPA